MIIVIAPRISPGQRSAGPGPRLDHVWDHFFAPFRDMLAPFFEICWTISVSKSGPGPPSAPPRDPMTHQRAPRMSQEHPFGAQGAKSDAKPWSRGAPREPMGSKMEPKSHPKSAKMVGTTPTQTINKNHRKKHPRSVPKRARF